MQKYSPIYHTIYCLVAFKVAFMTMQGTLQNYVKFADPLNEMFFCAGALMIGFIYLYLGVANTYDAIKNK